MRIVQGQNVGQSDQCSYSLHLFEQRNFGYTSLAICSMRRSYSAMRHSTIRFPLTAVLKHPHSGLVPWRSPIHLLRATLVAAHRKILSALVRIHNRTRADQRCSSTDRSDEFALCTAMAHRPNIRIDSRSRASVRDPVDHPFGTLRDQLHVTRMSTITHGPTAQQRLSQGMRPLSSAIRQRDLAKDLLDSLRVVGTRCSRITLPVYPRCVVADLISTSHQSLAAVV